MKVYSTSVASTFESCAFVCIRVYSWLRLCFAGALCISLLLTGCGERRSPSEAGIKIHGIRLSKQEVIEILKLSPLPPSPSSPSNAYADRPDAARLGQFLFFETSLSGNGEVSCATCHQPSLDWTDGKPVSEGIARVSRNAPTLLNLAHNRWYFWDGRKDSLWSQSLGPMEHPDEMGGNRLRVFRFVADHDDLRRAYEAVFGVIPKLDDASGMLDARPVANDPSDPLNVAWLSLSETDRDRINRLFVNLGKAIEAFERLLISRDSAFDRMVAGIRNGNREAMESLAPDALRGLRLFVGRGECTLCHLGPNFTDREFHNIGLDRGTLPLDIGRFKGIEQVRGDIFNGLGPYSDDPSLNANTAVRFVAQKDNNLGEFKTPTLRNISMTGPYMHDGRFGTLREVVEFYSQLDQEPAIGHREESLMTLVLTESEMSDLVAFLESLSGAPLDEALLSQPVAP